MPANATDRKELCVVLVDHGSRADQAHMQFSELVKMLEKRLSARARVRGAHMELAKPLLFDVLREELANPNVDVVVVPHFLFHGRHVESDIPKIAQTVDADAWRQGRVRIGAPLGVDARLVDLLEQRLDEALQLPKARAK